MLRALSVFACLFVLCHPAAAFGGLVLPSPSLLLVLQQKISRMSDESTPSSSILKASRVTREGEVQWILIQVLARLRSSS